MVAACDKKAADFAMKLYLVRALPHGRPSQAWPWQSMTSDADDYRRRYSDVSPQTFLIPALYSTNFVSTPPMDFTPAPTQSAPTRTLPLKLTLSARIWVQPPDWVLLSPLKMTVWAGK